MPGIRKAKHDISPMMRNAFLKGIGIVARNQGKTVPELMATWIEEDWKAVINAMGKFVVREKTVSGKVEHEHKHTHVAISEIDSWLAQFGSPGKDSDVKKTLPN